VDLSGVTLTGTDRVATPPDVVLVASDMTGGAGGWRITATSTTLTDAAGHHLPDTATRLLGATAAAQAGACSAPKSGVSYAAPLVLPAGATPPAPITIFNAEAGTGLGPSDVSVAVRVDIPANAYAGAYSSTWTLTIASGP
jgi:hypothetical protein